MEVKLRNIKPNFTEVLIGNVTLFFSYETIIGFTSKGELKVSENVWSNTTGKHLNQIEPNKTRRLSREDFMKQLDKALKVKRELG